jgi:hypothetical protein
MTLLKESRHLRNYNKRRFVLDQGHLSYFPYQRGHASTAQQSSDGPSLEPAETPIASFPMTEVKLVDYVDADRAGRWLFTGSSKSL